MLSIINSSLKNGMILSKISHSILLYLESALKYVKGKFESVEQFSEISTVHMMGSHVSTWKYLLQ